ncbi:type II secretion system F family protein [Eubacteriales bacterium OttesenSCG-928-M02]|nr:type II secretion system F family protein [Eubacteriales bacterium OttesenSCG-928-M02]
MAIGTNKKTLRGSEVAGFCAQLAMVVGAGISLEEGLLILRDDAEDTPTQELLDGLIGHVQLGGQLHSALRESGRFPRYMVQMVEIGETSGRLEQVLYALSDYYDRNEAITKSVKNAITYPSVMIVMMLLVILVLIVEVLPIFQDVFAQLGGEMSAFAQGIMAVGSAISRYSAILLGVLVALAIIGYLLWRTPKGKASLMRLFNRVFKKLSNTIASGRFASAMSLMLESGMDVDQSLTMAGELIENENVEKRISEIKRYMQEGSRFSDALVKSGIFSGMHGRMVIVGFRTGALDTVMQNIARRYEEEIDESIGSLISVLEPTLVAILSIIVGMILLSVMLPLMGIMSAIG